MVYHVTVSIFIMRNREDVVVAIVVVYVFVVVVVELCIVILYPAIENTVANTFNGKYTRGAR